VRRALLLMALALAAACRQDMHDQPKYKPIRPSPFFADGRTSRPLVDGTVARGHLELDTARTTGKSGATYVANPLPRSEATVQRGRERYDIYCSPCHDRVGTGGGMIVQRGYKPPPSLHEDRLRAMPLGYFFDVMTNGFGAMADYSAQVPVNDRWAIAAYIRALQLSQHAVLAELPEKVRAEAQRRLAAPAGEKAPE